MGGGSLGSGRVTAEEEAALLREVNMLRAHIRSSSKAQGGKAAHAEASHGLRELRKKRLGSSARSECVIDEMARHWYSRACASGKGFEGQEECAVGSVDQVATNADSGLVQDGLRVGELIEGEEWHEMLESHVKGFSASLTLIWKLQVAV